MSKSYSTFQKFELEIDCILGDGECIGVDITITNKTTGQKLYGRIPDKRSKERTLFRRLFRGLREIGWLPGELG